jgi:hypothetical protein
MNHGELPAFPETRENTMRSPTDPEGGIDVKSGSDAVDGSSTGT